jgi:CubicO group peptidase (beta-lactamase class C family)
MNNTGYDHHGTILANRASGYEKNGSNYRNAAYLDMTIPYAAGSLYSTVEDLYLWDQALYTNQLLSKDNMDLLFTKHIKAGSAYYGYGWGMSTRPIGTTNDSVEVISHGGGINGFNTSITRIPSEKSMIVLFNNTGGAPLGQMNNAILGILYDVSYDMPKKSLANSLYEVINKDGIAEGLKYFEKFKDSETYSLREGEMNNVGYQLLQSDKIKEAIEVFKLNAASFPESGNVYNSLGEAYLKDGNKELAIKNYKKSVELDPKNDNGIKILKELQSNN